MVELIKVSKTYHPNIQALSGVSISIRSGEMVFITGRSGAGKTTFLKLLCKMELPTRGLVEIDGLDIRKMRGNNLSYLRQQIGVAYQDFKLLTDRTVSENISIAMEVSYRKPQIIRKRVKALLEELDLSDKHNSMTGDLSRGEQQRVTLARAVANSPKLILVDEPTGNLDATTTARVMEMLIGLNNSGATVLIATHDHTIYRDVEHRLLELRGGQMHQLRDGVMQ
ncbi:MAG: cell division ATP-binding protein FtsE [Desulfobulbaceae bacterium]|nr:cell division ATP-binding protein FtsE [Desulfofustis sp.]RZW25721.1 MAG: cell division ATP-binding protein FtsE [Desulfobulbaceae bacterium]